MPYIFIQTGFTNDTGFRCLVLGIWYLVFGIWYLVLGVGYWLLGFRCWVLGVGVRDWKTSCLFLIRYYYHFFGTDTSSVNMF